MKRVWLCFWESFKCCLIERRLIPAWDEPDNRLLTLAHMGFWHRIEEGGDEVGDPTLHLGAAYELALRHGLFLSPGTAVNAVRCDLPGHEWRGDEMDRLTVQDAVVDSLIRYFELGILRP